MIHIIMPNSAIEREQCKACFIIAKREQTRDEVSRYDRKVCRPVGTYGAVSLSGVSLRSTPACGLPALRALSLWLSIFAGDESPACDLSCLRHYLCGFHRSQGMNPLPVVLPALRASHNDILSNDNPVKARRADRLQAGVKCKARNP